MEGENRSFLSIRVTRAAEFSTGLALVLFSLLMPKIFHVGNFHILEFMKLALACQEKTELMKAALLLVALNALRACPHYIGAFFVGESFSFFVGGKQRQIINNGFIFFLLLFIYDLIDSFYSIHYDFGLPAILLTLFVILMRWMDYENISLVKKAILLFFLTVAVQFLDIMPMLSTFPVGRGETSQDIKHVAEVMEGEALLNVVGCVGILLFGLFAILLILLLRDENNLKKLFEEKKNTQREKNKAEFFEMQSRIYQEIQYLVHELKSPLTSIQTLVGMMKMRCEKEGNRERDIEYLERIETSVEQVSKLISEIIYEDHREIIRTQKLVDVVLAKVSVMEYADRVRVENAVPEACVCVNQVLFTRALINLFTNASQSEEEGRPLWICFSVERVETETGRKIRFTVQDNGKGIELSNQEQIWNRGFSTRGSSGLGLAFVEKVIEGMGGDVLLESRPGKGSAFALVVEEEEVEIGGKVDDIYEE